MVQRPALILLIASLVAPALSGCFTSFTLPSRGRHVSPDAYARIEAGTPVAVIDTQGLRLTGTFVGVDSSGGTPALQVRVGKETRPFATDEVQALRVGARPWRPHLTLIGLAVDFALMRIVWAGR